MKPVSFLVLLALSGGALAGGNDIRASVRSSVQASTAASQAAVHGVAASGKATSGLLAAPVMLSGGAITAVGEGATTVGQGLSAAAGIRPGEALPITDESISVMSPADALRSPAQRSPAQPSPSKDAAR